jgi:hypothetical protein
MGMTIRILDPTKPPEALPDQELRDRAAMAARRVAELLTSGETE